MNERTGSDIIPSSGTNVSLSYRDNNYENHDYTNIDTTLSLTNLFGTKTDRVQNVKLIITKVEYYFPVKTGSKWLYQITNLCDITIHTGEELWEIIETNSDSTFTIRTIFSGDYQYLNQPPVFICDTSLVRLKQYNNTIVLISGGQYSTLTKIFEHLRVAMPDGISGLVVMFPASPGGIVNYNYRVALAEGVNYTIKQDVGLETLFCNYLLGGGSHSTQIDLIEYWPAE